MRSVCRLSVIWLAIAAWGGASTVVHAAVAQRVQSGTTASTTNGVTAVTITSVDPARSVLIFSTRHDGNRPVNSEIRGRLASATTIEFERVTNESSVVQMDIQWYVVTFGSGVQVQRGEVDFSDTTVNVSITPVASLSQAFVLWSKTPNAGDNAWGSDDPVVGELTSTSNLQFRTIQASGHRVAWQVVEFTNSADIGVQRGTTALTGTALSDTITLGTAVDVGKTFVLAGFTTSGGGNDAGSKLLRARLVDATTIVLDRATDGGGQDMPDIVWQVVELKDDSSVVHGNASFPAGTAEVVVDLPTTNTTRAVAFASVQGGSGQNMGLSPYTGDDVPGVATVTASLTASQLTLDRNSAADSADVGWFVVQFAGGRGFEVGSFTKATGAGATQTIPHGLGEVPKALILWTGARTNESFGRGAGGIAFRSAASAGSSSGVLALSINKPAGTMPNDVMVASIAFRPHTVAVSAPAGWTLVRRTNNSSTAQNSLEVYLKVAGASEPSSYTWSFNTSTGAAGGILSFSGVDVTDPIDVEAGQTTGSGLSHAAPSVTTTLPDTMLVTTHAFSSGATWTPPTGMTEAVDVWSEYSPCCGESLEMDYLARSTAGATGTRTATASNDADVGVTHALALNPGSGGAYMAFGITDGTTSRSVAIASQDQAATSVTSRRIADRALTLVRPDQAIIAEADLQSWDETGFTLGWTTNDASPYVIHFIAIGGSDVSAKVVDWTMGTTTGNLTVTGVGFQPNVVLHAHAGYDFTAAPPASSTQAMFGLGVMDADGDQWAYSVFSRHGRSSGDTQRGQQTDACLFAFRQTLAVQKEASWVSMDADGFTVDFTNASSSAAGRVVSLALAGVNVKPGSFLKATGAAPASQAITGLGFEPNLVMLASVQDVTQANPVTETRLGVGASDGALAGSTALFDANGAADMNADTIDKTSKVFVKVDNSTPDIDAEADFTSLDADGFTINWTTNDAVPTEILYLALARIARTEVRLLTFRATRYPRGVLLAWRTGYEIDNLGFHLYREVAGERVRVTRTLVAGSGLMAGHGQEVTTPQSYAFWDTAAGAQDPDAQYWLEDVDFAGVSTWHGPIVPDRGELVAPDVATSTPIDELTRWRLDGRLFFVDQGGIVWGQGETELPRAALDAQWDLAAGPAIKIGVSAPGWYRVGQPELVAAGLDPQVDPRYLHLYLAGVEQAVVVTGEADGRFDPDDAVEFYGTGTDTPYTDTHVYWLAVGEGPGQRVPVVESATQGSDPAASFWFTRRQKERSIYFAALRNGEAENWFGSLISESPTEFIVTASNLDPAAPAPAELEVALQGVTIGPNDPDHRVAISVNGTEVGTLVFDGQERGVTSMAVPHDLLLEGDNVVSLVALGGEADMSLFDVLRLSYWHTYRADADQVRVTTEGPGDVTIGGFAAHAVRVVDITDPGAAVELVGEEEVDAHGLASITVGVPDGGSRVLLAFTEPTMASPAFVRANQPSTWHTPAHALDHVAIADAAFAAATAPLSDLREQQGLATAVADVEDLYDEFNFGEKAPDAIKDFLLYATATWTRAPRFVVLVGDATIDPRDYAGFGNADFVPTRTVPMNAVALETASDEWFADFDEDGLPEMAVGRLPARTPEQAATMVAKTVGYELEPDGAWAKQVTFVSDDDDAGGATSFQATSARLAAELPAGYTDHQLDRGQLGADALRDQLFTLAGQGQLLVNFLGHGSTRVWGHSGDLLANEDVAASWTVGGARLPVVVAMNCLNGFFNGIYDEESLAEAFVRAPGAGAVAVWASSSVTPAATQGLVNEALFHLIFQSAYATLGESVAAAKQAVTNRDLRRSWVLFGDPALRLKGVPPPGSVLPTRIIGLSGDLAFGNVAVNATATRTLTISNDGDSVLSVSGITYPAGFSGAWSGTVAAGASQDVTVTFAPTAETVYGGTVSVAADQTTGTNAIAASGIGNAEPVALTLNPPALGYAAVSAGGTLTSQTSAQTVTVTQSAGPNLTWTATPSQPWMQVSPTSGTGNAAFIVSIVNTGSLPASGTLSGTVRVSALGAANAPSVNVSLSLHAPDGTTRPFGALDLPSGLTTVSGSIAVGGWAVDDVEISRVEVFRDRVPGEPPQNVFPPQHPGHDKIYVATAEVVRTLPFGPDTALFVDGARPDIEALFPLNPWSYRAGWGYMMLTRGLPNQGTGVYTIYAYAFDRDGTYPVDYTLLGSRTFTSDNSATAAPKPFGALDAPFPGETVSGIKLTGGWALTQPATCHVVNVWVGIDSAPLEPVIYGDPIPGFETYFPTALFADSPGAGAAYFLDSTLLANGLHQIGYLVQDSCGREDGIGSRFFSVLNGIVASATAGSTAEPPSPPLATTAAPARQSNAGHAVTQGGEAATLTRGYAEVSWAPWQGPEPVTPGRDGVRVARVQPLERVALRLTSPAGRAGGTWSGHQVVEGQRRALPAGSSLDAREGVFYWQPGAGFLGSYDLVFVRTDESGATFEAPVRVEVRDLSKAAPAKPSRRPPR